MDVIDYWRFCDELTVVQAAILIVNEDPASIGEYVDGWQSQDRPPGYVAVLSALQHSIVGDRLRASRVSLNLDYQHPDVEHPIASVDWRSTRVQVEDLKVWLERRGVQSGFFFPEGPVTADYLNRKNPQFSSKLAAAVDAWKAVRQNRVQEPSAKSVKADLLKWLNLHAPDYGLSDEDGKPNNTAIEEVAKVANWDLKGGAPKTPGN